MRYMAIVQLAILLASGPVDVVRAQYGNWSVRRWTVEIPSLKTNREGFEDTYISDERIAIELPSTDGRAQLVIFHQLSELHVYVKWNEHVDEAPRRDNWHNITTTYWFDNGPACRQEWRLANELQATFYPDLVNLFLADLAAANTFTIRVTPFGSNHISHTFNVAGLKEALEVLDGHCDYKLTPRSKKQDP